MSSSLRKSPKNRARLFGKKLSPSPGDRKPRKGDKLNPARPADNAARAPERPPGETPGVKVAGTPGVKVAPPDAKVTMSEGVTSRQTVGYDFSNNEVTTLSRDGMNNNIIFSSERGGYRSGAFTPPASPRAKGTPPVVFSTPV